MADSEDANAGAISIITHFESSAISNSFSAQQLRKSGRSGCLSLRKGGHKRPRNQSSTASSESLRRRSRIAEPGALRGNFRASSGLPPSPPSSDDESFSVSGEKEIYGDGSLALPTPPASDDEELDDKSNGIVEFDGIETSSFPLRPTVIPINGENRLPRTPRRDVNNVYWQRSPASPLPDRFISNRNTPTRSQSPAETFRVSKTPEQLLPAEKLLRDRSETPDPFGPLRVTRIRNERVTNFTRRDSPLFTRSPPHTVGTTNASEVPLDPLGVQNRQVSAGAVWNIGGTVQANFMGPVRGVSNGRGGFISSGSNAPMYESHFLDDLSTDQDVDQMERRLATALDIDQTSKVLNISRPLENPRIVSTGSVGIKSKRLYLETRHEWKDSAWTLDGISSCKSSRRIVFLFSMCAGWFYREHVCDVLMYLSVGTKGHEKREPNAVPVTPFRYVHPIYMVR